MNITEILVLHHTHVDIGYTHPPALAWELHNRALDEAMDQCERTADYPEGSRVKWTCEVTGVALHWLKTASVAQVERMRRLVANGQMSFGAMLLHWTAAHQEDLLRESLHGIKVLRDTLGANIRFAMQTDVNGVPWSVPDMLLDAGIEGLMMNINIHMGGFALTRPSVFRWGTPAGRELTVFSGEHYNAFTREAGLRRGAPNSGVAVEQAGLDAMQEGLENYFVRLAKKGWKHDFAILTATHPTMDDNGPPNPELPELIRRWNESGRAPFIRIVSLDEMFERIGQLDSDKLPVHGGDWTDYWTSGIGASAQDVVMSRRAHGALWGVRALETCLSPCETRSRAEAAAVEAMHIANEHTWTTFGSTGALGVGNTGRIEPTPLAEQCAQKSAQCASALTFSRMARRDALDALSGNPPQAAHQEGVLVYNPSEITRRVCLRLPNELIAGDYRMVAGTKHRLDVIEDILADTRLTSWTAPVDVPPLSYVTVPVAELAASPPVSGVCCGENFVASPFWQLAFDPASGAILSLVHAGSDTECFDATTGFDLFGAVQETLGEWSEEAKELRDPRASMFIATERNFDEVVHEDNNGWATDWDAVYNRPGPATRVEAWTDPEGAHLDRWFAMPGVTGEMRLTISLLAHEDRVRFTAFFNKADIQDPESLFFSFPLKMPEAQAYFDTAGVVTALEREQLPGSSRGWFTAGSLVAVAGDSTGSLTLACPDAPLFQIGGFNYGRDLRDASKINQALLFAWPTNNYWNTNFRASQPGWLRFRYELTYQSAFDPAASSKFAAAVARPVMFHPVVSLAAAPASGALVDALPNAVSVVSIKPAGPDALMLVLRNHGFAACPVSPVFPGRPACTISLVSILEENPVPLPAGQQIEIPARSVLALHVSFPG
jgi:alpha-mannosidase